jgi:hypothetical protein
MTSPRRRRQRPAGSEPDAAHPTSGPRRRRSQVASACGAKGIPGAQEPARIKSHAEMRFEDDGRLRRI